MLNKQERIESRRIYLRILTVDDASDKYCSWINDSDVNKYLVSKRITKEDLKIYIDEKYNQPGCLFFGIFLKENGEHIGNIKLEPIDFKKKIATLGMLIGVKNYWGKGYATETLKMLINYSFNILDLEEINLGLLKQNIGALKAYEKSGFKFYETNGENYTLKVLKKEYYVI